MNQYAHRLISEWRNKTILGVCIMLWRGMRKQLQLHERTVIDNVGTMIEDGHLGGCIHGGDPATWYPTLWAWVVRRYTVSSVLDVGCGEGYSVKKFKELGVTVLGLEGCEQAICNSPVRDNIIKHDFVNGPYVTSKPIELIWCCEFVEHLEEVYVVHIMKTFSQATKLILMTYAGPQQTHGHHHVNLQPESYWINLIENTGFRYNHRLTRKTRTLALRDSRDGYPNHYADRGLAFTAICHKR